MNALVTISRELSAQVAALRFPSAPFVYNPLDYARAPHEAYLERWGARTPREVLMVGMNPGPFGMAQTGVPFGDVTMVRDFVGVEGPVDKPAQEHPRRPIAGFACHRSEVSGTRFWGWARERFGTAERSSSESSSPTGARSCSWRSPDGTFRPTSSLQPSAPSSSVHATTRSQGWPRCCNRSSWSESAASPNSERVRRSGPR